MLLGLRSGLEPLHLDPNSRVDRVARHVSLFSFSGFILGCLDKKAVKLFSFYCSVFFAQFFSFLVGIIENVNFFY
jgi:hypothetical protein